MDYRFGIDLGGTKIELIALDDSGAVVDRRRVPTPQGQYDETVKAIADLVRNAEADLNLPADAPRSTVGVGIPGTISSDTGLVKNANSTCLIGKAFKKDVEASLVRPVRVANDADCFVLSEAIDGAAADANIVFGVILGTGVGGGLAINKTIVRGPNAITGEWGHNPLPWPGKDERPGPRCYCGLNGCIETFLSGPGLCRDTESDNSEWQDAEAVAKAAASGDPEMKACMQRYTHRLARALASVINVIDPHVIVLGGGLSNIQTLYSDVPTLWSKFVFSDTVSTHLRPPKFGDSSGVRGAAWLWPPKTKSLDG